MREWEVERRRDRKNMRAKEKERTGGGSRGEEASLLIFISLARSSQPTPLSLLPCAYAQSRLESSCAIKRVRAFELSARTRVSYARGTRRMESSTISKSKQKGKEVETAVPTIGEQRAEAEKRSFVKSCFPSEQLFPGSSTKFSWLFATIEPRCFHLSSAENLSARRLYRIRQLARPLRVFSSFFLFRFHNPRAPNQPARQLYVFKGFYYCPGAAFDTDTRTFCCNDVAGLITAFVYQRSLPMFFCFHVASCNPVTACFYHMHHSIVVDQNFVHAFAFPLNEDARFSSSTGSRRTENASFLRKEIDAMPLL